MKVTLKRHPGQEAVFDDKSHRFGVVNCGRQWGKTHGATGWLLELALDKPGDYVWTAPVYGTCRIAFDYLTTCEDYAPAVGEINLTNLHVGIRPKGSIHFASLERPHLLRGHKYAGMVCEEWAHVKDAATIWNGILAATLLIERGPVRFISTPAGRNHFWQLSRKHSTDPEWAYWHFNSYTNPFVDKVELDKIKGRTPDLIWRQEYMAEFLEDAAAVFRGIDACVRGAYAAPAKGNAYVIGWDVAKTCDHSVADVMSCDHRATVAWDRVQGVPWSLQVARVADLAKRYNDALVVVDSTGVGDPIYEALAARGVRAVGYKFTAESKRALVEALALEVEGGRVRWPDEPVVADEMRAFEYEIMPSGQIRYSAPEGQHDDCVMAKALAVHGAMKYGAGAAEDWTEGESGGFLL